VRVRSDLEISEKFFNFAVCSLDGHRSPEEQVDKFGCLQPLEKMLKLLPRRGISRVEDSLGNFSERQSQEAVVIFFALSSIQIKLNRDKSIQIKINQDKSR